MMKLLLLVLFLCIRISHGTHYYGEELFADVSSNSKQEIITIHWRIMWKSGSSSIPSAENLKTCSSGSPCPSGPKSGYISMSTGSSNCVAKGISTVDGSATYDSWTGISSVLYYPIASVPTSGTIIGLSFSDSAWGLLSSSSISNFGAQLSVLTARRKDNNLFNSTPRSPIAAIVTIWPDCNGCNFTIPVIDPDGDPFQCHWSSSNSECKDCCDSSYATKSGAAYPFTLTTDCNVIYTGGPVASNKFYAICIQMVDFYPSMPSTQISSSSLQFIVEVAKIPNPCTTEVSPLVTDPCSVAMVPITPVAVCPDNLESLVPNTVVPSNYSDTVGSIVDLGCVIGYAPSSDDDIVNVTCVAFNSTNGVWDDSSGCSCMDVDL